MAATKTVVLVNRLNELERLAQEIEAFGGEHGLSAKMVYALNLSLDELFTNIISYGYADAAEHRIEVTLMLADGLLVTTLSDDGKAFNPLLLAKPDAGQSLEERRIGGWGIQFVREMMDDLRYARVDNRNVLRLTKKNQPPDDSDGGKDHGT